MIFESTYCELVTLDDGRCAIIRLLRPSDRERIAAGFDELSPRAAIAASSRQKTRLTSAELEFLTSVDHVRHVGLAAIEAAEDSREGKGLGVGRYILDPDDRRIADMAITVVDEAQGIGLRKHLLRSLIRAALERGFERFQADILATNRAMFALTRELAPERQRHIINGVARVELDLLGVADA